MPGRYLFLIFARISASGGGWTGGVSDGLFGVSSGTFSGLMTEQLVTDRYGHQFKSDDHKKPPSPKTSLLQGDSKSAGFLILCEK
jgi:hypothetical protein